MIKESEVFKIGTLAKTHGLQGEIAFRFDSDIFDRVDCPYFVLKVDGILVPFFIEEYRFKGSETALITFTDINSEEKASRLQGLDVYFPRSYYEESEGDEDVDLSWDYFIGFSAIDKHLGELGVITNVDTQTINTLFLIQNDNGSGEIIVPAVEEFIVEIDSEQKIIYFEFPEGLVDSE